MRNPFERLQEESGATSGGMGLAMGLTAQELYHLRKGTTRTIPPRVLGGLRAVGVNPEDFQREYEQFREEVIAAEQAKMREALGGGPE